MWIILARYLLFRTEVYDFPAAGVSLAPKLVYELPVNWPPARKKKQFHHNSDTENRTLVCLIGYEAYSQSSHLAQVGYFSLVFNDSGIGTRRQRSVHVSAIETVKLRPNSARSHHPLRSLLCSSSSFASNVSGRIVRIPATVSDNCDRLPRPTFPSKVQAIDEFSQNSPPSSSGDSPAQVFLLVGYSMHATSRIPFGVPPCTSRFRYTIVVHVPSNSTNAPRKRYPLKAPHRLGFGGWYWIRRPESHAYNLNTHTPPRHSLYRFYPLPLPPACPQFQPAGSTPPQLRCFTVMRCRGARRLRSPAVPGLLRAYATMPLPGRPSLVLLYAGTLNDARSALATFDLAQSFNSCLDHVHRGLWASNPMYNNVLEPVLHPYMLSKVD
ncbi:hypothetical protein C8R44DRAFT_742681 [Mycena epipterygia]|nr:hypothetical protein C8R44DRAFT_742681 [Mycena epipterygia]